MASLLEQVKGAVQGATGKLAKGSKLPSGHPLKEDNPEQATVSLDKLSGKILVVGVPGAFTPPCSSHVPGYVNDADKFTEKGIKGIYVVAVNDAFTTQAWKEKLGAKSPTVHFLADDTGAFTLASGMGFDASGLLGGLRSQRYVAVVEDGTVQQVFIEEAAPNVEVTKADKVLSQL